MKKLIQNQAVRYVFFGGCTTLVNLAAYYLLRQMIGLDITTSNTAAILLAILFAYVVNKLFVFEHRTGSVPALLKEAGSFIGMRLGTMLVEVLGVLWLACIWGMHDMAAKVVIQFVILVLNYLISKFIVFKEEVSDAEALAKKQSKRSSMACFLGGFLISALITGVAFAGMGVWPFGDKTVLIIDSLHQYLPFYTDFHEKIVNGESFLYSFSGGLGYNFWSTYAYYMASPLNFLMAFIPMENVCDFMDLVILLKIALCGGCFSWYLHKRDPKRKYIPVVFGVMFALSNFVIGYYFNLMWLDSVAMLPLMMLGIERIVEGKSGRLFGLSLFYGLWCNYYIGFMLCVFACLYFLVRWISSSEIAWERVWKSCVHFAWYALLAGGMAAMVLLPAFMGLSSSESMQGNSFPSTVKFYESLGELLENHMIMMEPVNISSTQVGLNVYCGMAAVLLAILYLFDRKIRLRERLAHYGLAAFLLLSFAFNILNYIWHGFHVQNGLPNRFAFIYIAVLLVMAYDALGHIRHFSLLEMIFSAAVPIVFLAVRMLTPEQEIEQHIFIISMGLLLLYAGVLLIGKYADRTLARRFPLIISAVLLVEVTANGIYGISCSGSVTRSIYLDDQSSYQTMMAQQEDAGDGFYRSEVDRQRMRNVTMFVGGNGMVMFNSTMQGSVIDFCDSLGIEARTNKNGYLGVTKLMNDVFGIRYMASPSDVAETMYQFRKVTSDDNLTLYKNENALSLGFMVKEDILDWDTTAEEPLEVQNSFVELATGHEPIFVLDRYIEMMDGGEYGIKIPENKQVYLCIDKRVPKVVLNTPEYSKTFSDYTDHLYVINSSITSDKADFTVELKETQTQVRAEVYTCANSAYQEVIDLLAEHQMRDVQVDGNQVRGQVETDEAGILLLTIPYDEGWKITVDGEEVQAHVIGGALTGISLEEGVHEIEMKYTPAGLWMGSAISLICTLLYLISGAWEKRHPKWFVYNGRKGRDKAMEFIFSEKANQIQAGIFAVLNEKKIEMERQGRKTWNLSVGTPDFKPAQHIMDAVSAAARKPENYKYSLIDIPELVQAMQDFYMRRFGVSLKPEEIMTIYGSQEGIAHIAWALCDPGDLVLVPNPGYQIFKVGPQLCDADIYEYPLYPENDFLPDFDAIPEDVAHKARFMIVNYPANPVCKVAPDSFYPELIAFAKKYNIIILHDNAYSDIVFGEKKGGSFLRFEGAKEVGVEFYSLSKSFNYTGARASFVVGNETIVRKFRALRTQFDYGMFLPVQYGAIAALTGPFDAVEEQCREYEKRSRALCGGLREIGWNVPDSEGTMFVWARLPEGFRNSEKFCVELMEKSGVICVPGSSFGSLGEGYVRFALVLPPQELRKAAESIGACGILKSAK